MIVYMQRFSKRFETWYLQIENWKKQNSMANLTQQFNYISYFSLKTREVISPR